MQLLTVKGERFDFVNSLNLRFKRALTTNNQTAKTAKQTRLHCRISRKIVFERNYNSDMFVIRFFCDFQLLFESIKFYF